MGILPSFASEHRPTRLRKVPQLNDNEAEDQPIEDPKQKFKVESYFIILDTAINSLSERFSQFDFMSKTFGVLFDLHNIYHLDESSLTNKCKFLEQPLIADDDKDIDAKELFYELKAISGRFNNKTTPTQALDYICSYGLISTFPNLFIALKVLLTLPVSVASPERSSSKLKLIKTYLTAKYTTRIERGV